MAAISADSPYCLKGVQGREQAKFSPPERLQQRSHKEVQCISRGVRVADVCPKKVVFILDSDGLIVYGLVSDDPTIELNYEEVMAKHLE